MDGSILALLERHGVLAYEQIATHLDEPPDAVRNALTSLRDRGMVDVLSVGDFQSHGTSSAVGWQLTEAGRTELARLRSGQADGSTSR
jgi:predicted ArsR family transcriptional regulator